MKGTLITAPIIPNNELDTYPTHYSKYGKGGHKEVTTLNDRNNIPIDRLSIGEIVYVKDTDSEYLYTGNGWRDYGGVTRSDIEKLLNEIDEKANKSDILKGDKGDPGINGKDGIIYTIDADGYWCADGIKTNWYALGKDGKPGEKGANGKSAYDLAVELGYTGTLDLWLSSLKGEKGDNGKEATNIDIEKILDNIIVTKLRFRKNSVNKSFYLTWGDKEIESPLIDESGQGGTNPEELDNILLGNVLRYYMTTSRYKEVDNPPQTPNTTNIIINNGLPLSQFYNSQGDKWTYKAENPTSNEWLWMTSITQITTSKWSNWSSPIPIGLGGNNAGSDLTNIEFIFALSTSGTDFKKDGIEDPSLWSVVNEPNWINNSKVWLDNPLPISNDFPYEWMSFRTKDSENGWGRFSTPVVWCSWGKDGIDGDGVEYIFYGPSANAPKSGSNQDPSTWYTDLQSKNNEGDDSGKYNEPEYIRKGTGWRDDMGDNMPVGTNYWVSIRKKRDDLDNYSSETRNAYWHTYSSPKLWSVNPNVDPSKIGGISPTANFGIARKEDGTNYALNTEVPIDVLNGGGKVSANSILLKEFTYGSVLNWFSSNQDNSKISINIPEGGMSNLNVGDLYYLYYSVTALDSTFNGVILFIITDTKGASGDNGEAVSFLLDSYVIRRDLGLNFWNPERITPSLVLSNGSNILTYHADSLPTNYRITYLIDDLPELTLNNEFINISGTSNSVNFTLYHSNDWSLQAKAIVILDGNNGINAHTYLILPQFSTLVWDSMTGTLTGKIHSTASKTYINDTQELLTDSDGTYFPATWGTSSGTQGAYKQELKEYVTLKYYLGNKELEIKDNLDVNVNTHYESCTIELWNSTTLLATLVIPIGFRGKDGTVNTVTLMLTTYLRSRTNDNKINKDDLYKFFNGRTIDANNGYPQDFVFYNTASNTKVNEWGVYICIVSNDDNWDDIPNSKNWVKSSYDVASFVYYLVANEAFIKSLTAQQVLILDNSGTIVAGMTNGLAISDKELYSPDGNAHKVNLNGDGNGNSIRIFAGVPTNNNPSEAPFRVNANGNMYAKNATLENGTFSGDVTASTLTVADDNNTYIKFVAYGQEGIDWNLFSNLKPSDGSDLIKGTPIAIVYENNTPKYFFDFAPLRIEETPYRTDGALYYNIGYSYTTQPIALSEIYENINTHLYYSGKDTASLTLLNGTNYYRRISVSSVCVPSVDSQYDTVVVGYEYDVFYNVQFTNGVETTNLSDMYAMRYQITVNDDKDGMTIKLGAKTWVKQSNTRLIINNRSNGIYCVEGNDIVTIKTAKQVPNEMLYYTEVTNGPVKIDGNNIAVGIADEDNKVVFKSVIEQLTDESMS